MTFITFYALSSISMWTSNFYKTIENTSVDRDLKRNAVFKCIRMNVAFICFALEGSNDNSK